MKLTTANNKWTIVGGVDYRESKYYIHPRCAVLYWLPLFPEFGFPSFQNFMIQYFDCILMI
jgi:hypothetical protein